MNFSILLALASHLQFFGDSKLVDYGNRIPQYHKPIKGKVNAKAKYLGISPSFKPIDDAHQNRYTYIIEVEKEDKKESGKKEKQSVNRNRDTPRAPTPKLCDYLGDLEEVDVPGCGGSVEIFCNGGCINIHKVPTNLIISTIQSHPHPSFKETEFYEKFKRRGESARFHKTSFFSKAKQAFVFCF